MPEKVELGNCVLYHADCLEVLPTLANNSVDAVVTDPPYGLSFMGKDWDRGVPGQAFWEAVLRVAKPGAHMLAFGGTRTFHRLACAIEDAGWEIRDCLMWVYGSGFPKSLDVSKAIDKAAGAERKVVGSKLDRPGYHLHGHTGGEAFGYGIASTTPETRLAASQITAPATDSAKAWQGWGTALKPAWEPILLCRKPPIGTVAANVLSLGTGAINVDACRVGTESTRRNQNDGPTWSGKYNGGVRLNGSDRGRWPANLIHDGSNEVVELFPANPPSGGVTHQPRRSGYSGFVAGRDNGTNIQRAPDSGSAARFFYCAKASVSDRDEGLDSAPDCVLAQSNQAKAELARGNMHAGESGMNTAKVRKNNHPTVKPTALLRYLCRLITPPDGIVLDPFCGSGSTGKAAIQEGFRFTGIEIGQGYFDIACRRVEAELTKTQLFSA